MERVDVQKIYKCLEIQRAKVLKFVDVFLNHMGFALSTKTCIEDDPCCVYYASGVRAMKEEHSYSNWCLYERRVGSTKGICY